MDTPVQEKVSRTVSVQGDYVHPQVPVPIDTEVEVDNSRTVENSVPEDYSDVKEDSVSTGNILLFKVDPN